MDTKRSAVSVALVAALASTACGPSLRAAGSEVSKGATPALAAASLDVLEDPRTRRRLAEVLGTPEVQRALGELSAGLSAGVVDGLSNEELGDHLTALVDRFTRAFTTALTDDMTDLQPAAQKLAGAISASVVRAASQEISRSLGPSMRAAMENDVAPAMAAMLRTPEFRAALGDASREVARQVVYGSNEALTTLAEHEKQPEKGPLGAISEFFEKRTWLLPLILVAMAFAVPFAWLLRERAAARRYRAEAERKTTETVALIRALDMARDGEISREDLVAMLKRQFLPEVAAEPPASDHEPHPGHPHRTRHA